jgi:hypothetical protein
VSTAVKLRMGGGVHRELVAHLFPGDGKEAVALALCGRSSSGNALLVQEVVPVPYESCPVREPECITWRTECIEPALTRAMRRSLAIVKIHSHPNGYPAFSSTDDVSDRAFFPSVYGWLDDDGPHASAVMLPDGTMFGRSVDADGKCVPLARIAVVGDNVKIYDSGGLAIIPSHAERQAQLFGAGTTLLLRSLEVGVVGCSGTGSIVIELLHRLGVRSLALIEPDRVEDRNLNRILGSTIEDASASMLKTDVQKRVIRTSGLGTEVRALAENVASRPAVELLAGCDFVFGCMDSHDGRRTLNRIATYYLLPYVDVGVSLEADGRGGINQVCAAAHYLKPGGSSLLSRRAINVRRADAEAMARKSPELYKQLRAEGYIANAHEPRPAVVSVNALAASLGVNEFLARMHPYRDDPNQRYCAMQLSLSQMHLYTDEETDACPSLARCAGRGDVEPPLDMPDLSPEPVINA